MRSAPPVTVEVPGRGAWRIGELALTGLAAVVSLLWCALRLEWSTEVMVVLVVAVAMAVAGWQLVQPAPDTRTLRWDGSSWQLDGQCVKPQLMVDAFGWMLLRCKTDAARPCRWLALSLSGVEGDRQGLRAAVHARSTHRSAAGGAG